MRVLVTGGRNYADEWRVRQALDVLRPRIVIQGGARGADSLAAAWADERRAEARPETYHADWDRYGKGAGHIRNQRMLDQSKPDLVLAFPGGRGTRDMIERARKAGVPVLLSSDWVFQGEGL